MDNRGRAPEDVRWLQWDDLDAEEKVQAADSYAALRAREEECREDGIDTDPVESCRFERMPDGYIYVDL